MLRIAPLCILISLAGCAETGLHDADYTVAPGEIARRSRLVEKAETGDVRAMVYLGQRGEWLGTGERLKLLRKAEATGSIEASNLLGAAFENGQLSPSASVLTSPVRAAQHYRTAAERGDTYAKMTLALAYADGKGVPQDFGMAEQLLTEASTEQPWANYWLGGLLFGVKHDAIAARGRLEMAAQSGIGIAYRDLAKLVLRGDLPSADKDNEALALFTAGANQEVLRCYDCLFLAGESLYQRKEFHLASTYWRKAAEGGDTVAMVRLADAIKAALISAADPKVAAAGWLILSRMERGEEELEMARLRTEGLNPDQIESAWRWAQTFFAQHLAARSPNRLALTLLTEMIH